MMRESLNFFIGLTFVLYCSVFCLGQSVQENETISVGLYVEDIYDIDYSQSTYEIIFFIWVNSENEFYEIEKYIDVIGAIDLSYSLNYNDTLESGVFHSECRIKAKILNEFNANNFPFDKAKIKLMVEFIKNDSKHLNVIIDKNESRVTPDHLGADKIKFEANLFSGIDSYKSNFGNTDLGKNVIYQKIQLDLELERDKWNIFIKLFVILFIAFFIAASSVLLPLHMSEEKIGLNVGALFTAIGNKYTTDDILPMSSNFNLSDKIHSITFLFLTALIFFAILQQRYKLITKKIIDFFIFFGVIYLYAICVIFSFYF